MHRLKDYYPLIHKNDNKCIRHSTKQCGAAALAILAVLLIIITASTITAVSLNKQKINNQNSNVNKIDTIKSALIGFALRQTIPGLLPCPDTNGNGLENKGASGNCQSFIGLIPHKTLGLPELFDASGSPFWYAVSANYTLEQAGTAINASLIPSLSVDGKQNIIAVIITPNEAFTDQNRTAIRVSGFLEGINAEANTKRFTSTKSTQANDTIFNISNDEFWPFVSPFVLATIKTYLTNFKQTPNCNQLPWASSAMSAPFNSEANLNVGKLPFDTAIPITAATGCPATLNLPSWVKNHWANEVRYKTCETINTQCLTVNGQPAQSILVAPNTPHPNQTRPSNHITDYFEGANANTPAQNNTEFESKKYRNFNHAFNDQVLIVSP